jgi:hypothetical protein
MGVAYLNHLLAAFGDDDPYKVSETFIANALALRARM